MGIQKPVSQDWGPKRARNKIGAPSARIGCASARVPPLGTYIIVAAHWLPANLVDLELRLNSIRRQLAMSRPRTSASFALPDDSDDDDFEDGGGARRQQKGAEDGDSDGSGDFQEHISPRKKRARKPRKQRERKTNREYAGGGTRAPKRDMGWEKISGAAWLNQAELDDCLEKHDRLTAPGLGYQMAGTCWVSSGKGCSRCLQKCGYCNEEPSCPGLRCIIRHDETLRYEVYESRGPEVLHNSHDGARKKGYAAPFSKYRTLPLAPAQHCPICSRSSPPPLTIKVAGQHPRPHLAGQG